MLAESFVFFLTQCRVGVAQHLAHARLGHQVIGTRPRVVKLLTEPHELHFTHRPLKLIVQQLRDGVASFNSATAQPLRQVFGGAAARIGQD